MLTTSDRGREKRQASQCNPELVRRYLNVTGDFKFFEAVNENVGGSIELKERVAASLLISYVQGASRIWTLKHNQHIY